MGSGGPVGREPQDDGGVQGTITFDESLADYDGVWVEFQDGFKLYLPSDWNSFNLSREQYDKGIFYMAGDVSGRENGPGIALSYGDKEDYTLEEIVQIFSDGGFDVDGILNVNGILCVSFLSEVDDACGLVFFHPQGEPYYFMLEGFEYTANADLVAAIMCSLTPTA